MINKRSSRGCVWHSIRMYVLYEVIIDILISICYFSESKNDNDKGSGGAIGAIIGVVAGVVVVGIIVICVVKKKRCHNKSTPTSDAQVRYAAPPANNTVAYSNRNAGGESNRGFARDPPANPYQEPSAPAYGMAAPHADPPPAYTARPDPKGYMHY